MTKLLLWGATIIFTLITLFFGTTWLYRLSLDYNEEGRYFDERSVVVFDTDALLTFSVLTLLSGLIAILCWILIWRELKRP